MEGLQQSLAATLCRTFFGITDPEDTSRPECADTFCSGNPGLTLQPDDLTQIPDYTLQCLCAHDPDCDSGKGNVLCMKTR